MAFLFWQLFCMAAGERFGGCLRLVTWQIVYVLLHAGMLPTQGRGCC